MWVTAADIDNDDDIDILVAFSSDDRVAWFENDGTGTFTARDITTTADGANMVHVADVNSDTYVDVLVASYYGGIALYQNTDGSGNFDLGVEIATDAEGRSA